MVPTTASASMMAPSTMASAGTGSRGERRDLEALAAGLELHGLHGARTDVEPHDSLGFTEHSSAPSLSIRSGALGHAGRTGGQRGSCELNRLAKSVIGRRRGTIT